MNAIPSLCRDSVFDLSSVRTALVWAMNMPGCPTTSSVPDYISGLLARVRGIGNSFLSPERKAAVRNMLRFGAYKPAGRSKPSSEYLLAAALDGSFPLVNGPVNANNAISLEWGYPASIFDLDRCGAELVLRRGLAGESYIFNASGQRIDLEDLLCVCRAEGDAWVPCGNPVKDSMATKTTETTQNVVAVIYAPKTDPRADLSAAAETFAALLDTECEAMDSGWKISE